MGTKFIKKNQGMIWIILFSVIIILIAYFARSYKDMKEEPLLVSKSTLIKAIDISELSTAEYKYKGIAQKYKDKKEEKVQCHIYYEAIVKAGIDMKDVKFDVDHDNKSVKANLPPVKVTLSTIDEGSIDTIPENPDLELKTVLTICQKDVNKEAKSSTRLLQIAEENLKSTIEALTYPLLEKSGYKIIWEEVK